MLPLNLESRLTKPDLPPPYPWATDTHTVNLNDAKRNVPMRWLLNRRLRTNVFPLLLLASIVSAGSVAGAQITLHVSPQGNDEGSGTADAAFATLRRARDAVRALKSQGGLPDGGVRVVLHGGVYRQEEPLVFTPNDSGTADAPIVYTAAEGEKPIISGGRVVGGFRRNDDGSWSTTVDAARDRGWVFRQLFANDRRYILARSPNEGQYFIRKAVLQGEIETKGDWAGKSKTAFGFFPGDLEAWSHLEDMNLKLYFSWNSGLYPLKSVDEETLVATLAGPTVWPMPRSAGQCYLVENHPGALDAPGEWQLDRQTGRLTIIPFEDEKLGEMTVIAPVAEQFVVARGEPEAGRFVEHIRLEGISFRHGAWRLPPEGHGDPQAESTLGAALEFDAVRHVTIQGCEVAHIGNYAIWFRDQCSNNRIIANHLHDLGGGGVRIGVHTRPVPKVLSHDNLVDNNFIHDGGHLHAGAVGICVGYAHNNTISHNEICDLRYTGISLGWTWSIVRSGTRENTVEHNHVHHVMRVLDDGGGIYSLGLTPGSTVCHNHIHDIGRRADGVGHGVYLDGGSSGVLTEDNLVHDVGGGGIRIQHGTACLTVLNNICAYCGFGLGIDSERTNIFAYNIVYLDGEGAPFRPEEEWASYDKIIRNNLYWHEDQQPIRFLKYSFDEWRKIEGTKDVWYTPRMDDRSRIADPKFVDAPKRDFRLKPDSPALAMGFRPFEYDSFGLYGDPEWTELPRKAAIRPLLDTEKHLGEGFAKFYKDDFELDAPGEKPALVTVIESDEGYVAVTNEKAAGGKNSLKFVDSVGQATGHLPHIYFRPDLAEPIRVRFSFDLYREPGAMLYVEWRDYLGYRQTGPDIRIDQEGKLLVSKAATDCMIPEGRWVHVEMTDGLDRLADGKWHLRITDGDETLFEQKDAPCDADFASIQWLGIVSYGDADYTFYVDNIKFEALPQ